MGCHLVSISINANWPNVSEIELSSLFPNTLGFPKLVARRHYVFHIQLPLVLYSDIDTIVLAKVIDRV